VVEAILKMKVQQHRVDLVGFEMAEGLFVRGGSLYLMAALPRHPGDDLQNHRLVVNEQDFHGAKKPPPATAGGPVDVPMNLSTPRRFTNRNSGFQGRLRSST